MLKRLSLLTSTLGRFAQAAALFITLSSCTGGTNSLPTGAGGIRIAPGEELTVDLQDIVKLNISEFNVSLKSVSADFKTFTEFHDLTGAARQAIAQSKTQFSFVVPKNVAPARPFVIVVDIPELQDYLVDAIYTGETTVRPGVASRLAFDLLESYNTEFTPKALGQYSRENFNTIKSLIQTRIDQLVSQSEHLNYSSLPFATLVRFFKNGLAFNPEYLTLFRAQGVDFVFDVAPLPGVVSSRIPSDQTTSSCFKGFCFEYAKNFRVRLADNTEKPAPNAPFKHNTNSPAQMMPGAARPAPSLDLTANEKILSRLGEAPAISVTAQGFDMDDDYMEKSMRVQYTPRKLPDAWKARPSFNPQIEAAWEQRHAPSDQTILNLSSYDQSDTYRLDSIDYDEALNPADYKDESGNDLCDGCHSASRDVFYFVTDGMAWLPYHWKFAYSDQNRQPKFILNEQNGINSTYFDELLHSMNNNEPEVPGTNGWIQHISHCETNPDAVPAVNAQGFQSTNYYTRIKSRADGPWSCAFKVYDPDVRDDPNGAPDVFYFSASRDNDPFTMIQLGAKIDAINPLVFATNGAPSLSWPPIPPADPEEAPRIKAMTESTDPEVCGNSEVSPGQYKTNLRCAIGLSQVIIDNAVKVAAESLNDQTIDYTIKVFDRAVGGQTSQKQVKRAVQFTPIPPLLINYSNSTPNAFPVGYPSSLDATFINSDQENIYRRTDTFASEIIERAKVHQANAPSEAVGIPSQLIGNANRQAVFKVNDLWGVSYTMSPYLTEPHTLCNSADPADINGNHAQSPATNGQSCRGTFINSYVGLNASSFTPATPVLLGSTLRKKLGFDLYTTPYESDDSCGFNVDPGLQWDQRSPLNGYLGKVGPLGPIYNPPVWIIGPSPSPTPASRTPGNMGGWVFEVDAIDYDNVDLRSGEPTDPVYLSLEHNVAYQGTLQFCTPKAPNLDSRLGETYLPTNTAGTNGVDPDACEKWAPWDTGTPFKLQPIPVFYQGKDSLGNPITRKLVYHRFRALWIPKDQGGEKKYEERDPPGLIRNFLSNIRLHGNVYTQKANTLDRTEPFDPATYKKLNLDFYAKKRDFAPCVSGLLNRDLYLHDLYQDSGEITFGVTDTDHTNSNNPTYEGSISGIYESELQLLGETNPRTILDPEIQKFVLYTNDCTQAENRDFSKSKAKYSWLGVKNATSYSVSYTSLRPGTPGRDNSWIALSSVAGTGAASYSTEVSNLDSYKTYYFKNTAIVNGTSISGPGETAIQANPRATTAAAPPTVPKVPAIWYSSSTDGSNPRIRFKSLLNASGKSQCIRHTVTPLKDSDDVPFTGVWVLKRTSPSANPVNPAVDSPILFKAPWLQACTGRKQIEIAPYQQMLLVGVKDVTSYGVKCIPSTTDPGYPNVFSGSSTVLESPDSVTIDLGFKIDPSLTSQGALALSSPAPTVIPGDFRLNWFPSVYGGDIQATIFRNPYMVANKDAANGIFFDLYALNNFQLDLDTNSETFGRKVNVGLVKGCDPITQVNCTHPNLASSLPIFESLDSSSPGALSPRMAPSVKALEHNYSVRVVDFDSQPTKIAIASATDSNCTAFANATSCVRKKGDTTLQVFAWAPETTGNTNSVTFPFRALDQATPQVEDDPYDVMTYAVSNPSPAPSATPINTPTLSGLGGLGGRATCTTAPAGFPGLATLRMDLLDSFKKCNFNWNQVSSDAGKEFKFDLTVQDNFGADPSATPIQMGAGAVHPKNISSSTIDFFWDATRTDLNGDSIIPTANPGTVVQYTVDEPTGQPIPLGGTPTAAVGDYLTYDSTLATCATTIPPANRVCTRARVWNTVSGCVQASRYCSVTVPIANLYKTYYFRTKQTVTTNNMGAPYLYTSSTLREAVPYYTRQPNLFVQGADSFSYTNSPTTKFTVELYSLEKNKAPFFTANDASTSPISSSLKYTGTASSSWSLVFPGGLAPSCTSTGTGYDCTNSPLTLDPNKENYLLEASAKDLEEIPLGGTKYAFEIYAKDTANLTQLKTLSITNAPTKAYIVDGPNKGATYAIKSFLGNINWKTTSAINAAGYGTIKATFEWAPTDEEAYALSNPGGFLIPITVTDQKYDPSKNESGFETSFTVPAKPSTVWIWCKLKVRNNSPSLTYIDQGVSKPLNGATLQFQTGTNAQVVIRVTDPDVERYKKGSTTEKNLSFFLANFFSGNPAFTSATAMTAPSPFPNALSPTAVVQDFKLVVTPSNADMGISTLSVSAQDPGDPSIQYNGATPGLAIDGNGGIPANRGQVAPISASFFINVVGKPTFLAPAPPVQVGTPPSAVTVYTKAFSYPNQPMNYPLSISITRPNERTDGMKNFFMGIQVKPAVPPPSNEFLPLQLAQAPGAQGFYINENYMLKLGATTFNSNFVNKNTLMKIGAVVDSGNCQPTKRNAIDTSSATTITLVRIKESTGVPEYCNITSANETANLAITSLQHTIAGNKPNLPTISSTGVTRTRAVNANDMMLVNQEYRDFTKRCFYCQATPSAPGFTFSGGEISSALAPLSTSTYLSAQNQRSIFTLDKVTNVVHKSFEDLAASGTNRKLQASVLKGDTLKFRATLNTVPAATGPRLSARWYINGCLKASNLIETQDINFTYVVPMDAGGRNDDCSGQFERAENGNDDLGKLQVSLRIVDATEAASANSDGSTLGYSFALNVINISPIAQVSTGTTSNPRAQPISGLTTTAANVKFLLPVVGGGRSLIAYTEKGGSSTSLRIKELAKNGGLSTINGNLNITLACVNFNTEPSWFGLQAGTNSMKFAMANSSGKLTDSLESAYSVSSTTYGQASNICYNGNIPYSNSPLPAPLNQASTSNADTAAKVLAYSTYTSNSRVAEAWKDGNGTGFHIDGVNASSDFWSPSYPIFGSPGFNSNIYSINPPAYANYANNTALRNLVQSEKLFQMVGWNPAKPTTNTKGFVLISSLSANGKALAATPIQSIGFGSSDLCNFVDSDGVNRIDSVYPIDAAYHASSDTLFVIATDFTANARGRLIEILNATSSPTCRQVTDTLTPPSKNRLYHNTSTAKLVVDATNGVLWGAITKSATEPGQIFSYDFISRRAPVSQSLNFAPHSMVFSPSINAIHVFNATYSPSPLTTPTLYRVW